MTLFETPRDFEAFEKVVVETFERTRIRILAYAVLSNHWHFLLWPREDGELSEVMRWMTVTHTQRWHAFRRTSGTGPIYQGRFKSFPVESDDHFWTVARYVERNPFRAGLTDCVEGWRWSSLWRRCRGGTAERAILSEWPLPVPGDWVTIVRRPQTEPELDAIRRCVRRGSPFGSETWVEVTAKLLGLESILRPRGRPAKRRSSQNNT
jgi:putative transposase